MSKVMRGVLLMPPSLWSGDPLDVQQRHSVYRAAAARIDALEAEVERLRSNREKLQASGEHPAPCARHCEAQAFRIEIRQLNAEVERLRALIADDAHAASFQSLGQYRSALLRAIKEGQR